MAAEFAHHFGNAQVLVNASWPAHLVFARNPGGAGVAAVAACMQCNALMSGLVVVLHSWQVASCHAIHTSKPWLPQAMLTD